VSNVRIGSATLKVICKLHSKEHEPSGMKGHTSGGSSKPSTQVSEHWSLNEGGPLLISADVEVLL
jgi:hypothetical protein